MYLNIPHVGVYIDVDKLDDTDLAALASEVNAEVARRTPSVIVLNLVEGALARCGHTIDAIRLIRARVGVESGAKPGLRAVKDAVDNWRLANVPGFELRMSWDATTGTWKNYL